MERVEPHKAKWNSIRKVQEKLGRNRHHHPHNTHTHTHIQTHNTHTLRHIHTFLHSHTYTQTYSHLSHIHSQTHTLIHIHTLTYIHMCSHTHMHNHIHPHTQLLCPGLVSTKQAQSILPLEPRRNCNCSWHHPLPSSPYLPLRPSQPFRRHLLVHLVGTWTWTCATSVTKLLHSWTHKS